MKEKILVIVAFISFQQVSFAQQFNYKTYPSFDSVINSFRHHYILKNTESKYYLLARKPDGWHVLENSYSINTGEQFKDWLFWSGADNSYRILPITNGKEDNWLPLGYEEDKENFRIHPYWGYENWSKDIIQVFGHKQLDDSLTYALGRAYSNEAWNYLWNQKSTNTNTSSLPNFSKADIDAFIFNDKKAITCFQKTTQLNPHFETKVGNIFTKYSNEYLAAYYTLTISGLEEEAKQFIADSLYDNATLSNAKNLLMSCPENALLVTYGDNDTYPLIYLQEKMGYRKDVMICNYTLLGMPRFIHYLIKNKNVAMAIPEKLYTRMNSTIVSIDSFTETEPLEAAIKNVSDTTKWTNGRFPYIQSHNIFFSFSSFDKISQKNMLHVVALPFPKKYIYPADMALLDILFANGIKINICFTSSCDSDVFKPFRNYLQMRGLVYEFTGTTFQNLDAQSPVPAMNVTETLPLLQKKFDYDFNARNSTNTEYFIASYKYIFIECITALLGEQNKSVATDLVQQYLRLFPASNYPYGNMEILLAERLIKLDDTENLNNIGTQLINEGNKFLLSMKAAGNYHNQDDLMKWLLIISEIKSMDKGGLEKTQVQRAGVLYNSLLRYYK